MNLSGCVDGRRRPARVHRTTPRTNHRTWSPSQLTFEVTETAAVANLGAARDFADRLTTLGCSFSLDDFGAGFGSFYYLKYLPFNDLKIDGEFITHCLSNPTDQLVIDAVVSLAQGLGKSTIAEYVGDEDTLEFLAAQRRRLRPGIPRRPPRASRTSHEPNHDSHLARHLELPMTFGDAKVAPGRPLRAARGVNQPHNRPGHHPPAKAAVNARPSQKRSMPRSRSGPDRSMMGCWGSYWSWVRWLGTGALVLVGYVGSPARPSSPPSNADDLESRPEGVIVRIRRSKPDPDGAGPAQDPPVRRRTPAPVRRTARTGVAAHRRSPRLRRVAARHPRRDRGRRRLMPTHANASGHLRWPATRPGFPAFVRRLRAK